MKIKIGNSGCPDCIEINVNKSQHVEIHDMGHGVTFSTPQGPFGVAIKAGCIEVSHNHRVVYRSNEKTKMMSLDELHHMIDDYYHQKITDDGISEG